MKKCICSLLVIFCLFSCALPICAVDEIRVMLDGTQLSFDAWYDVSGMAPNTVYYYQFRTEVNGTVYSSAVHSLTTMNTSVGDKTMDALLGALQ